MNTPASFGTPLTRRLRARLAGSAAVWLALGCGGGDGGIDGTGASNNSMSFGTVTAFGSVWVNGVRFDTAGATFKLDDNTVSQNDLRVGMVVRVDGSIDDRRASTVTVDDALKGRVEQVIDANRMLVMGQTVQIDNTTRFDNGVVPAAGDYVEVHGLVTGEGTVAASFIEKKATLATPPFVVKGIVKNHNPGAASFQVGTLTVNYAGANTGDMPGGSWNGLTVDAKGGTCAGNPPATPVCGTLTASKVEPAGARVADIAKAEVEGFVTSLNAAGFVIAGQTVVVNAGTVYVGGVAAEVVVGVKLEVEGPIAGGVLTATKVAFKDNVRFEADVASVNAAGGTLTLAGLPGITVQVNALTQLKNVAGLAALATGDHLRIKARPGPGNTVLAIELERRSADTRVILEGPVSAVSGTSTLTILGVAVDTSAVSEANFRNLADAAVGRTAFFAALAGSSSTAVKARGTLGAGGAVAWDQMELED
ncbi:MAG: hypothetical protein JNJ89_15880 [Rubrivivax sp.]|nr:hypothetical protein [Rubrivivax sp.]